jgi:prevent-host-death family protein
MAGTDLSPHEEPMMPTISEVAARATFADLVSRVAYGGERVVVTRRGERLVALIPAEDMVLLELLEYEFDLSQARQALADPANAQPIDWDSAKMHRGS